MSNKYIPQLPMLSSGLPNALAAANSYRDALLTTHQTVQIANEIAQLRSKDAPIRALASQIIGNIDNANKDIPFRIAVWIRDNVKYTQETPMVEILQGPYRTLGGKISVETPMGKFKFNGTGTGDCDDLSILFATLCRSLGIEAFLIGVAKQDNPDNFFHAMGYCNGVFYELSKDAPYGGVGGTVIASTHPFDDITGLLFNPVTGKQKRVYLMKANQKGNNMSGSRRYGAMHGGDCGCGAMGGPNCICKSQHMKGTMRGCSCGAMGGPGCTCQSQHMNGPTPDCGCDEHHDCGCGGHPAHMGATEAPAAEKPAGPPWLTRPIGTPAYVGEPLDSLQPRYSVPLNLYAPSRQISGISMNGSKAKSSRSFGVGIGEGLGDDMRGSILTGAQMPQPTVYPHNVMQGSILTDTQMPQPTVFPHNVMQGSILTDTQMPQPTVFPHNVMQGTKNFEYGQAPAGQRFFQYGQAPAGQRHFQYGQAPAGQNHFEYGQAPAGQRFFQYGNAPSGQAHWSYGDPEGGMGKTRAVGKARAVGPGGLFGAVLGGAKGESDAQVRARRALEKDGSIHLSFEQVAKYPVAQRDGTVYVNGKATAARFNNGFDQGKISLPISSGVKYTIIVHYSSGAVSLPIKIKIPEFSKGQYTRRMSFKTTAEREHKLLFKIDEDSAKRVSSLMAKEKQARGVQLPFKQVIIDAAAQRDGVIYVNGTRSNAGFGIGAESNRLALPLSSNTVYKCVVHYAGGARSLPETVNIPNISGLPPERANARLADVKRNLESVPLRFELDVRTIAKRPTAPPVSVEEARKKPLADGTHHIGVAKITYSQTVSEPRVQWDGDIYLNGKFSGSAIRDNKPVGPSLALVKGANILIVKYKSGAVSLPVSVILNDATLKAIKLGKFVPIKFQLDPHSVKPSMLVGPSVKPPPTPPVGAPPIACSPPTIRPPTIRPPVQDTPPGMPPASRWDDEPVAFLSGKYDTVGQLPGMNAPVIGVDMAGRILVNATNIIPFLATTLSGSGTRMSACTPQPDGKIWVYFDSPRFEVTRPASGREELIRFDCGTPTGYLSDIESKISSYPLDSNKWPAEALAQFKQDSRTYEVGVQGDAGPDLTWAGYKNPTLAYLLVAQACAMMAAKQVVEGVLVSPGGPSLPTEPIQVTPQPVPVAVAEQVAAHDIADAVIAKTAEIAVTTNQVTGDSTPVTEVEKVETKVEEVKDAAEANNVAPEVAEKQAADTAIAAPKDLKEAVAVAKEVAKEEAVVAKEEAAVAKEEIAVKEAAAAPAEKKGKGGLVMLLAAATGVYFLTKG